MLPKNLAPFLKWAGGKRWLSSALKPVMAECTGVYFEPSLGSGAMFFHHRPKKSILSDTNGELIECYQTIRNDPAGVRVELERLAQRDPITAYYDVRSSKPKSASARAARFLYLNRTCWNGLYRVNLKGEFNVPRGTKTQILLPTDDFVSTSEALLHAKVVVADFEQVIAQSVTGDVVFADPPYTVDHNFNGFVKYNQKIFTWADQERLAHSLIDAGKRGVTVVCTNADHPAVAELYSSYFETKPLARASVIAAASQNRRQTTELLISNAGIDFA